MNQIEVHPYFQQTAPQRLHAERGILIELSGEEIAALDALDTGVRGGPEPDSITLENYGIKIPEA